MIENLPMEIFYMLMALFSVILAVGLIWKQGVFTMIAGIFLILMFIPVTSIDFQRVDAVNVTSSEVAGNVTITEDTIYEPAIEIDYTMKALIMVFAGLMMMFGWWQNDFDNPFGDSV